MAYADDIVCFLASPADLDRLHSHLRVYSAASNALVNFHKTEAISLRSSVRDYDLIWRTLLLQHRITSWHDATSASPIRYLGFQLYTSIAQRNSFLDQLLDKVRVGSSLQPSPSPILVHLLVLATFTFVSQCLTISCSPVLSNLLSGNRFILNIWAAEATITSLDLHHLLTTFCSPHVRSTSDLRIIAATLESIWLYIPLVLYLQ
ncbi:hypothetical protein MUCCIDRAFT_104248 [Mucor lusitanicus CBS 277.49]|uniref:Reverse transcriptase domain-containing protein n=1 Tax=Mucor lusitanicus CBS 277.49 TaxID=747725 RepID=A0A168P8E4_MUCCL|nr:hypothetical protein MUCCIDRAFT_104248 [Mucor lusitanicus CBS 277.49]